MNATKKIITMLLMLGAMCPGLLADETQTLLQGVAKKAKGSVVVISWTVEGVVSSQSQVGIGVCIADNGWFMTPSISPQTRPDTIKDIKIILPGADHTRIKAKLLGIDPATQMSFIQAEEKRDWNPIAFVKNSKLTLGSQVVSFGINQVDAQLSPKLGTGYISSITYAPGKRLTVTGGELGSLGSVVFDAKMRAIGIVSRQPFDIYQARIKGRTAPMRLRNESLGMTFIPVEEFAYILSRIPQDGKTRKLPWIGVVAFTPLSKDLAEIKGITTPALMLDQVIPGQAAANAGLKNGDIVMSLNGKLLPNLGNPQLTAAEFNRLLMRLPIGSEIQLGIFRNDRQETVKLKLEETPTLPSRAKQFFNKKLGLLVREKVMLDKHIGNDPSAGVDGLLVLGVMPKSPAAKSQIQRGDLITMVSARPVKNVKEFEELIEKALAQKPGSDILFVVQRGEDRVPLTVKNPK
ncbi:MAG: PDZ domain-containing protein [Phycisphaerae bacterium]|nr:PDZ domain-containing protein [Phycisphaerae bacterium]